MQFVGTVNKRSSVPQVEAKNKQLFKSVAKNKLSNRNIVFRDSNA